MFAMENPFLHLLSPHLAKGSGVSCLGPNKSYFPDSQKAGANLSRTCKAETLTPRVVEVDWGVCVTRAKDGGGRELFLCCQKVQIVLEIDDFELGPTHSGSALGSYHGSLADWAGLRRCRHNPKTSHTDSPQLLEGQGPSWDPLQGVTPAG